MSKTELVYDVVWVPTCSPSTHRVARWLMAPKFRRVTWSLGMFGTRIDAVVARHRQVGPALLEPTAAGDLDRGVLAAGGGVGAGHRAGARAERAAAGADGVGDRGEAPGSREAHGPFRSWAGDPREVGGGKRGVRLGVGGSGGGRPDDRRVQRGRRDQPERRPADHAAADRSSRGGSQHASGRGQQGSEHDFSSAGPSPWGCHGVGEVRMTGTCERSHACDARYVRATCAERVNTYGP